MLKCVGVVSCRRESSSPIAGVVGVCYGQMVKERGVFGWMSPHVYMGMAWWTAGPASELHGQLVAVQVAPLGVRCVHVCETPLLGALLKQGCTFLIGQLV